MDLRPIAKLVRLLEENMIIFVTWTKQRFLRKQKATAVKLKKNTS